MTTETKRQREKETVSRMIALYCRKNHGGKTLCPNCAALDAYAQSRSDRCPFMETKPFPLQLPDPLLPPGHTGKNPESPGLFRPPARSSATPSWPSAISSTPARRKSDWKPAEKRLISPSTVPLRTPTPHQPPLHGALSTPTTGPPLPPGHTGKNPESPGLFRPPHDLPPSRHGRPPSHRLPQGEKTTGGTP